MNLYFSIFALCIPASAAFVSQEPRAFKGARPLYSYEPMVSRRPPPTTSFRETPANPSVSAPPSPIDVNLSDKVKQMSRNALVKIQGNSLKTWSFQTPMIDRVQVMIKTEGRPLNAEIDLWSGPDNVPQRMNVYIEDGAIRPFNAIIETPGGRNTLGIRNTNTMEFPMEALVDAECEGKVNLGLRESVQALVSTAVPRTVQGGAVYTKPFDSAVQSVQVLLRSDGRPMYARIELLQGPNNNKQVMDIYSEDGQTRPFYIVMETPEAGNVVRIVNTATMEYPLSATVEPYVIDDSIPSGKGPASFFIVD